MPNTREKLIELVCSTEYGNGSLIGNNFQKGFIEKIADHLIANGVTVLAEPKTNADRIRAMSDEELAETIYQAVLSGACNDFGIPSKKSCNGKCKECILEWLQQPVEEK